MGEEYESCEQAKNLKVLDSVIQLLTFYLKDYYCYLESCNSKILLGIVREAKVVLGL